MTRILERYDSWPVHGKAPCRPVRLTRVLTIVFWLPLILLTVWPVWGATYYMRADGKAPNKTAAISCSSASTAMSVATHNAQAFSPDDVICLCDDGGDYKSSIIAPSSGTDGHPIIYKNADGDTPVIDLSINVGGSGWTHVGDGKYTKSGSGRIFLEDDVPLKAASNTALSDAYCSSGCWYYNIGSGVLNYKPSSGTPADHTMRTWIWSTNWFPYGLDLKNRSNITVYGLTINRCGGGIYHGQYLSSPVSPIKNITIHDNTITQCGWAIFSQIKNNGVESDVSIYNNQINYCNSGISAWTSSDTTPGHTQYHTRYAVTGNQILNLYSLTDTKMWCDGLLNSYGFKDHEGISFQDVQDSVIANNTITTNFVKDMTSDEYFTRGIYLYVTAGDVKTSGNSILRNYLSGHFFPAIYITGASNYEGFENNTYAYNIMHYGLSNTNAVAFVSYLRTDNPLNGTNYFVNNTIYNTSVGLGMFFDHHMAGNWVVRNNIIRSPNYIALSSGNHIGNIRIDHNIYMGNPTIWGFAAGGSSMTFTTWEKKGYDTTGSSIADPLFVNAGTDFHLQSGSPAINAGVSVGLLKDHAGVPISGNPDIGAFEFQRSLQAPYGLRITH